jgi:hypothetical protein
MTAPANGGTPEWTLSGITGSVAVTGSTDTAAPLVTVKAPFSVTETQVHTLKAGDGPVVANTARVSVCYMGVNGRDGSVFDSSYKQGAPVEFSLDGVVASCDDRPGDAAVRIKDGFSKDNSQIVHRRIVN